MDVNNYQCPNCGKSVGFIRKFVLMDFRYKKITHCRYCKSKLQLPSWFYILSIIQSIAAVGFIFIYGKHTAITVVLVLFVVLAIENVVIPIELIKSTKKEESER
jgi:DNA-directed RNA polymerase subunit RPC12/RpoP